MIMRLLAGLGNDPEAYDAALVRRVILDEAKRSSPPHVKTMTTAIRGYLRFLATAGLCRPGLDHAVPIIPQWRLSALPRYLPASSVEHVMACCDLTKPHGVRDRAILLLLARLGLRAGDIMTMRLDDIAWNEGAIRVCGKGRREIRLPLPQDAGDAILDYLSRARPSVDDVRIFLRSSAPFRPFKGPSVISGVVRLALERAGIADAPTRGANLLRHSAATSMLRAGASLDAWDRAAASVDRQDSPLRQGGRRHVAAGCVDLAGRCVMLNLALTRYVDLYRSVGFKKLASTPRRRTHRRRGLCIIANSA